MSNGKGSAPRKNGDDKEFKKRFNEIDWTKKEPKKDNNNEHSRKRPS